MNILRTRILSTLLIMFFAVAGLYSQASPYCSTSVFHFAGNPESEVILTVENTGPTTMTVFAEGPNPADPIDLLIVVGGSGANITYTNTANSWTATLDWPGGAPANVNLNILWSFASFGGNWQLSQANIDIPFTASCSLVCAEEDFITTMNGLPSPLEICEGSTVELCLESALVPPLTDVTWQVSEDAGATFTDIGTVTVPLTIDPAAQWFGFMNVFELPANGGAYVFGSGWGTADLVALFNGDELCLQPNQIGDPSDFWYIPSGGPGAMGNKIMEANFYQEDQTGLYAGQTVTFALEVTSNDFSCDHVTNLYIREFNPGFAGILNQALVPIAGPGVYTVSMPISATGGPVQFGTQTTGPNVWVTDAPACGSIKAIPVSNLICTEFVIPDGACDATTDYVFQAVVPDFNTDPMCTAPTQDGISEPLMATVSCPVEDFDISINGEPGPVALCPGESVELCLGGADLPLGGDVTWQVSTDEGASFTDIAAVPIALTLDPGAPWLGFMNVSELPANGGAYVFGSPWQTFDLIALSNGDELCLQPNQIADPDPFWYTPSGGPGAAGNKTMEANYYQESFGVYSGETISFSIEVTENTFSCGHETTLFIREYAPGFGSVLAQAVTPVSGPGVYTVTLPISTVTANPVQYGIQTVGPNVWATDAPACGSIKALPVNEYCTTYTIPAGGGTDLYTFQAVVDPFNTLGCAADDPTTVDGISEPLFAVVNTGIPLSCNDHINLSVSPDCGLEPNATMFLEGEPSNFGDFGSSEFINQFFEVTFDNNGIPVDPSDLSDYIGQTLNYTVTDGCSGNSCWGTITFEDKIAPELDCDCPPGAVTINPDGSFTGPAACIIECHDVDRYLEGKRGSPDVLDNCNSDAEPDFGGAQIEDVGDCTYKITQVWSLTVTSYPSGTVETSSCINEIYVDAPSLDDVECPDDVIYSCDAYDSPHLSHPDETGYPTLWNQDIKSGNIDAYCSIFATWDDVEIPACGPDCYGSNKILRTWTILDWCNAETITCTQVIKIVDEEVPTIIAEDVVASTDAWVCSADIWMDDPQVHDNCTYDVDWEIAWSNSGALLVDDEGRPITQNNHGPIKHAMAVPKGSWTFVLKAEDCCGNIGYDTISVTVLDKVAPVVVATQNIVVSLTGAYPDASAKVLCESVDNGSHDNCSGVWCEIRRDSDPCGIDGNTTYSNKIPEICDPWYDNDDHDYGNHVKFCCEDAMADGDGDGEVDGMVKVWIRVWDDANMDGEHGSYTYYDNPGNQHDYCEFNDNYNESWIYVTVEDKAPQALICPPDVTIPCHWDYNDLTITGEALANESCGHPHVAYTDWPEIHCGEGYVLREWFIDTNNNGELDNDEGEYPCVQFITIEFVESPLEVVCADFQDFESVPGNPDLTWFDPFNPNHVAVDCEDFEFPEPWQSGGKCNLIGVSTSIDTFWFEEDACFKAIKQWEFVDWCTDDSFTCSFTVSVIDTEPPTVTAQDTCFAVDDYWDADGDWNYCELANDVDVCAMGDDMGNCPSEWIKWIAHVDLWYDGNVELVYSSFLPHSDPFYVAPTPRGEKVTIELDKDDITAEWARHFIEWKAFDGCGNVAQTHQYVEVADKKAPTPYCIGISTALMSPEAGNLVELWASDFNLGSFDNCTTEDHLKYTFGGVPPIVDLLDQEHCFRPVWDNEELCVPMVDANGNIVSEEVNNCNGYENGTDDPECQIAGIQKWNPTTNSSAVKFVGLEWCGSHDIKVAVWDVKLNMDYCYVNLVIHGVECENGSPRSISGTVLTEAGEPVAQAEVTNTSALITGGQTSMMTQSDGIYAFTSNIEGGDYAITSYRSNDYLNGVSTLDLVMIQKHILGLTPITSAYKMVAADINNDEAVTAVDLVELRKLILGIYTELPANTSWRFVDADQQLNVTNPYPLNESVNISNLTTDMMSEDFVGIKVGDINGNVVSSANSIGTETRSAETLNLIKETLNGSVIFKAGNNFEQVYGYQFSMSVEGDVSNVIGGAVNVTEDHFGILGNNQVTTSFASDLPIDVKAGDVLFTLVGITDAKLVNGYTQAEAYVGNEFSTLSLDLRDSNTGLVYELGQNEPNPFSATTNINFRIGKAGNVTLSIYDVTGKTIKVINGNYEAGQHNLSLTKKEIGTSGIVYYKLESGDFTATKKMIIIE